METKVLITASNGRKIPLWVMHPDSDLATLDAIPIFFLHGVGECWNDANTDAGLEHARWNNSGMWAFFAAFQRQYKNRNFILFAPQMYRGDNYYSADNRNYTWPEWYVRDTYNWAFSNYAKSFDAQRACLTGLSLGGGGVLNFITGSVANAKMFSTAFACCPVGVWEGDMTAPGKANLPVDFFHAMDDTTCSFTNSVNAANAFNASGATIHAKARIIPYGGHNVWGQAYDQNGDPFGNGVNVWDRFIMSKFLKPVEMPEFDKVYKPIIDIIPLPGDGTIIKPIEPVVPIPPVIPVVPVLPASPVAKVLKNPMVIDYPNSDVLHGEQSTGKDLKFQWSKVSGGSIKFVTPNGSGTWINGMQPGEYVLRLTVTDSAGQTNSVDFNLTVRGPLPAPKLDYYLLKEHFDNNTTGEEKKIMPDKIVLK